MSWMAAEDGTLQKGFCISKTSKFAVIEAAGIDREGVVPAAAAPVTATNGKPAAGAAAGVAAAKPAGSKAKSDSKPAGSKAKSDSKPKPAAEGKAEKKKGGGGAAKGDAGDAGAKDANEPASYARRDFLLELEAKAQKKWREMKAFEVSAKFNEDGTPKPKFLVTFPYPYMNGRLHLGHAFSLSKAEYAVRYHRLKGRNALFPFGFHCTGMPIQAAANRLKAEIASYGCPPVFPDESAEPEEAPAPATPQNGGAEVAVEKKGKGKKSKMAVKTGGVTSQWDIMKMMVPQEDISSFTDPMKWLRYFPPFGKTDLESFGAAVDWRRSFITTSVNPFYDSFIRWQFNCLKSRGKVMFGKRANVYSVLDGQVCADHDRASGEGVGPQEYTIIKLRVLDSGLTGKLAPLAGMDVFLAPATLRPETMYGQTNCFVLPEGRYGAYRMANGDVLVTSDRAARGMAHQDHTAVWGQVDCVLGDILGSDLIGLPLNAPNATYDVVYTLPLPTISMGKGTGVVTSVPSDAPDDYAALKELRDKPAWRQKFGLTDEMVMPFEVVPIIEIPGYGDRSAQLMCEKLKIVSCKDADKLRRAKEEVYLKGFYEGIMLVGPCKGQKVCDAKPVIRAELIARGDAIPYLEPESMVMSRSGDECVVALTDQWYLPYGEEVWRQQVIDHINSPNFNGYAGLEKFNQTLGWLREWACTRRFGLGTMLPWDQSWVIESLSDSTIYMAYYTVAHMLQGEGNLDGSAGSPCGVKPEDMTDAAWDYVFLAKPYPVGCGVPEDTLAAMRREFEYWYPMDLRCSAGDLIQNHLTMALYNHAAIWEGQPELWPRGYWVNGHVLVDAEKMSKSKGNFLMLEQCVQRFSADATRFALADAGDSLEDANFSIPAAQSAIIRLYKEQEWSKTTLEEVGKLREGPPSCFMDRAFANQMAVLLRRADEAYGKMLWRDGMKEGFSIMQALRDFYRDWCLNSDVAMLKDLVLQFIEWQTIVLSPVCPHYAEHVWGLLGKEGSVLNAKWPDVPEVDPWLTRSFEFLQRTVKVFRDSISKVKPGYTQAYVYVEAEYVQWKQDCLRFLQSCLGADGKFPADFVQQLGKWADGYGFDKKQRQGVLQFASFARMQYQDTGPEALETTLPFDQEAILRENLPYMKAVLGIESIEVHNANAPDCPGPEKKRALTAPGQPFIHVF